MRILILGGCGFIGSYLEKRLSITNHKVIIFDSENRKREQKGLGKYKFVNINYPYDDIDTIRRFVNKGDIFIQLGWHNLPSNSNQFIHEDIDNNIRFNIKLFSMLIENKVRKIIFASSGGAVYGPQNTFPLVESISTNPISSYGIEKLIVEKYLYLLALKTRTSTISLRIGNAYGYYQVRENSKIGLIAKLVNSIIKEEPVTIWGNGSTEKDYIDVSDVSEAIYLSIINNNLQGVYNIGTGKGTTITELIKLVENEFNCKIKVNWLRKNDFDVDKVILDSSLFSIQSGWIPRTSIIEGISKLKNKLNKNDYKDNIR